MGEREFAALAKAQPDCRELFARDAKVILVTDWELFLRKPYELGSEILLKFNSRLKPSLLKASEDPGINHQQQRHTNTVSAAYSSTW